MSLGNLKSMHHLVREITGKPFFIAGGAVRDTLYGVIPKDYDCVLCLGNETHSEAFTLMEKLSTAFRLEGLSTRIYHAYGVCTDPDEGIEPNSFQDMFYTCMKVQMKHCQLDILLSKHNYMSEHVQQHDCNMNMVWFNGERICWEHGGNQPVVERLIFRDGISASRQNRMHEKYVLLKAMYSQWSKVRACD